MTEERTKVVYLFGAGASHACAHAEGAKAGLGLLMGDLSKDIVDRVKKLIDDLEADSDIAGFAEDVLNEEIDLEQVITFLEASGSGEHRRFAGELRDIFEKVLRQRLEEVVEDVGDVPSLLYAALFDMHWVEGSPEELQGILTLNYDVFIEHAIEVLLKSQVDFGVTVEPPSKGKPGVKLLKLHGSFGWKDVWPIERTSEQDQKGHWIPPGIQKAKDGYPFSLSVGAGARTPRLRCREDRGLQPSSQRLGPRVVAVLSATHPSATPSP